LFPEKEIADEEDDDICNLDDDTNNDDNDDDDNKKRCIGKENEVEDDKMAIVYKIEVMRMIIPVHSVF
jgi:hypothetical protein